MAEKKETFTFSHKELAEILIKSQEIHEGLWGITAKFGLGAGMVSLAPGNDLMPGAIVPVIEIGIQKFENATPFTADAAKVNPKTPASH